MLFAGIGIGAIDGRLRLPDPVWGLGLALFVYTVGIASGPGFFATLRRRGLPANALVLGGVAIGGVATVVVGRMLLGLTAPTAAGSFAGGLTNTPALAAILDQLKNHVSAGTFDRIGNQPVVGYSITYPIGVLFPLLAAFFLLRRPAAEPATGGPSENSHAIVCRTVRVLRDDAPPLGELRNVDGRTVVFSRMMHDQQVAVATAERVPARDDLVSVIGAKRDVRKMVEYLGEPSPRHLPLDRRTIDYRRMFVSARGVAGKKLADLDLDQRFGATVTRVRRGDVDFVASPDTQLELGDRVRVVAPVGEMPAIGRVFGDSYRSLSEFDILTFSLGIALGLLLGAVRFPLGGGSTFSLGSAGGPLVVGLVLGALGRTGPLVWQMPYSTNLTLRQAGTLLFLAGVGTRAGQAFAQTIASGHVVPVLVTGAVVTAAPLAFVLTIGKLAKVPPRTLVGMLAGMQTQPAVLAFASEHVEDDTEIAMSYATVYPAVMIAKIVIAQLFVVAVH